MEKAAIHHRGTEFTENLPKFVVKCSFESLTSTLSDYMITIFQVHHSGMDSCQAILPDTLRVNANLFQTDLCRNPGSMDGFELTIHGTGYPLPGGYDEPEYNLTM